MTADAANRINHKLAAGIIYTVLGAAGFSAKAILAKLSYRYGITGFATLTLRMLFALPLYLGIFFYFYYKQREEKKRAFRRDWFFVSLVGLFGYYLASWFDFVGLEYVSASFERLLLFIYPSLVLLISFFWLKRKIGRRELVALLVTYIGIAVTYRNETAALGPKAHVGAVYIIFAAITYAIYLAATERLAEKYSPLVFTSFAILVSAIVILIHAYVAGERIWGFSGMVYYYSVAMAIFCTVLPSLFVAQGIALIGSNRAAILSTLGPVLTIYLAYLVLDENINWMQALGTVCVLAGVALLTIKAKRAVEDF